MRFCQNCGQGNQDDAAFCIQCGAPLEIEPSTVTQPGPAGPSAVPPPPHPYQPPYARPMRPPTDGMAIASLVLSIASWLGCFLVAAIIGVILGYMSLGNIEESHGALGGEDFAKWGIGLGWANIALTAVILLGILVTVIVAVATR